jgi:sporulation protein YlmC with PRC-barrel domain
MNVVSQAGPQRLGQATDVIVDPDKGQVVAYRLDSHPTTYLATVDVAGYADDAIITKVPDAVQPVDELIRLKPFVDAKLKPIGLRVTDEDGQKLGKVSDFIFDSTDHRLMRVHVRPSWLRMLTAKELILPRERIIRITPSEVIVRYDSSVPNEAGIPVETEPIS